MKKLIYVILLSFLIINPINAYSAKLTKSRINYLTALDSKTRDIDKYFVKWAKYVFGAGLPFDPSLIKIQSAIESGLNFDPGLTSHAGAGGGMQIMPATRKEIDDLFISKLPGGSFSDRYYEVDIAGGTFYNKRMWAFWERKGESDNSMLTALMLASYNAGAGRVSKGYVLGYNWENIQPRLPEETQNYVNAITGLYAMGAFKQLANVEYKETPPDSDNTASDDPDIESDAATSTDDNSGGPEMTLIQNKRDINMFDAFLINCGYFVAFGVLTIIFAYVLFTIIDSLTKFDTSKELQNGNMAVAVFNGIVIVGSILGLCYVVGSIV